MKKLKSKYKIQYLKYLILSLFILPATIVLAQLTMPDFGTPFDLNGWTINTVDTGTVLLDNSVRKIDAHGICKNVQATDGKQYFVPTKSANEWNSFINGAPSGINISACTSLCNSITWTKTNFPTARWERSDISGNGKHIAAIALTGIVYISHDSGLTYSNTLFIDGYVSHIAMSANGMVILAHSQDKYVYISRDGGNSWIPLTNLGTFYDVAIDVSPDGSKIAIAPLGDKDLNLYLSNDKGFTFSIAKLGQHYWGDVKIVNSNPNEVYVAYSENNIIMVYKTENFGLNWHQVTSLTGNSIYDSVAWPDISVSDSGQHIVINSSRNYPNPKLKISNDYGLTWKNIAVPAPYIYDGAVHDSGVFCLRTGELTPVCSFDKGLTFVKQTSVTNVGPGYMLTSSFGFNSNNNIFIVSGSGRWGIYGGNIYIGKCNQ